MTNHNLKAAIGERLKKARNGLGMTQKAFCAAIGMPLPSLRDYELGKTIPGGEAMEAFVRAGINVNWLLTGEGEMYAKPARLLGQLLAEGRGSRSIDEMAKLLYVTPEQLRRYEQNLERPDAAFLKLFLLFAQGDKVKLSAKLDFAVGIANLADELRKTAQAQQPEPPPALDMDRMKLAIEAVEEGLAGRTIDPAKKANIILAAYDLLAEPTEEAKGKVLKLIKAAA